MTRTLFFSLLVLSTLWAQPSLAADQATSDNIVAIVGTGSVGSTLGPLLAARGYQVLYGSRNPAGTAVVELLEETGHGASAMAPKEAAARADMIIMAVPYAAVEELLMSFGDLGGKIIIDCINAVRFRRQEISLAIPSMAETIARLAPGARVIKTLNTTSTRYMSNPDHPQGTISMPIAGDDAVAKDKVAALVRALGFDPVDVGPLSNAAYLEAMGALYIHMNAIQGRRGNFEYRILHGVSE